MGEFNYPRTMEPRRRGTNFKSRIFYTSTLFFGYMAFGITSNILGPTLVDLSYLFREVKSENSSNITTTTTISPTTSISPNNTDNGEVPKKPELISLIFTFYCLGCILGCLFTYLFKFKLTKPFLNRQLITSIFFILSSLLNCFLPQIRSLKLFYAINFIMGFGFGIYNAVCTTWLMEMWRGKYLGSILQAEQLMYAFGGILCPVLVRSYVNDYDKVGHIVDVETRRHNLTIPFAIAGAFQLAMGILMFQAFFTLRYRSLDDYVDPNHGQDEPEAQPKKLLDTDDNRGRRLLFHFMITLAFMCYNAAEIGFGSFQSAYFQEINIDAKTSTDLVAIGSTAFMIGRALNVIITRFLPVTVILFGHLILNDIGFVALLLVATMIANPLHGLMVCCAVIGYAHSAVTPALFNFAQTYTKVDDRHNSLYCTAIGLPMLVLPIIIGKQIQIVVYFCIGSITATVVIFTVVKVFLINSIIN